MEKEERENQTRTTQWSERSIPISLVLYAFHWELRSLRSRPWLEDMRDCHRKNGREKGFWLTIGELLTTSIFDHLKSYIRWIEQEVGQVGLELKTKVCLSKRETFLPNSSQDASTNKHKTRIWCLIAHHSWSRSVVLKLFKNIFSNMAGFRWLSL